MIYLLLGKSAAGKDRMYRELLSDEGLSLKKVVPYTTRPKRAEEREGEAYFFTDETGYEAWRAKGRIIEERIYQTMAGPWRYFTADDGQILPGEADYLLIGTPASAVNLRAYFGEEMVRPLYIEVEDGTLLSRALARERQQPQPRYDELCRRFLADREDFSEPALERAGVRDRFDNNGPPWECLVALRRAIAGEARHGALPEPFADAAQFHRVIFDRRSGRTEGWTSE